MTCTERQRLFDDYYAQVSACFATLKGPSKWWIFANDAPTREAVIAAENARVQLEQHERDHGCGRLNRFGSLIG